MFHAAIIKKLQSCANSWVAGGTKTTYRRDHISTAGLSLVSNAFRQVLSLATVDESIIKKRSWLSFLFLDYQIQT